MPPCVSGGPFVLEHGGSPLSEAGSSLPFPLRSDWETWPTATGPAFQRAAPLMWPESLAVLLSNSQQQRLFAPDDLANPRVIQADQLAYVSQRKTILLSLGKCLTPRFPRNIAVALELPLSSLYRFAGGFALGVVRHQRSLSAHNQAAAGSRRSSSTSAS